MGGLLGTFAKPQKAKRVPSLHFTNQSPTNGQLMHGEVPVDRGEFGMSQAISSIEVRQTDREM